MRSAMGYLATADATGMAAETQAQCLLALEQVNSMETAARAAILAGFTSGQAYTADADYSPRAWLIHKTRVTKGAAVAYTAWARRTAPAAPAAMKSPTAPARNSVGDADSGAGQGTVTGDTTRAWEALEQAIIGKTTILLLHSCSALDVR